MGILFKALLFFSFFSSFSIFNIESADWGLQVSWFIALVIFLFYPFTTKFVYKFPNNYNFRLVTCYFFSIIVLTIIAWILLSNGFITTQEYTVEELMGRSVPHLFYFIFDYLVYVHLVCYLNEKKNHEKLIRIFITYTFYFIVFWGIYQWLTTFDILPYWEVFNNNLSTGFTYLRFVEAHRSSSVFPEPSEYAYFLGFMLPFVFVQWFYRKKIMVYSNHPWFMFVVWLAAVAMCQSMSLFIVLPFMFLYVYSRYVKLTPKVLLGGGIALLFVICGVIAIESERIMQVYAGEDGSAIIRYNAFISSYELFFKSPLVGVGFGAIRGLDLLGFLLGTTGIIGTILFCFMVLKFKIYSSCNLIFIQGLKSVLIVTLISNPVMDHLFIWIIFAFITVPLKGISNENRLCNSFV